MKRALPLMLPIVLAITLFTPALAAGKGISQFALVGKITAIDPASRSVTIQVLRGNMLVKPYIGQTVTIKTTAKSQVRYSDGAVISVIKFDDLKVGNTISASDTLTGEIWKAGRVTAGAKLNCLK